MATTTKKAAAPKAVKAPTPADTEAQASGRELGQRRVITGLVVSDKMQKTITVKVERRIRHGLYAKYIKTFNKFKAHDEKNEAKTGDLVEIIESRPLSKDKRWALRKIVRRATVIQEVTI
jgi:small subunit ribosomal protein S17